MDPTQAWPEEKYRPMGDAIRQVGQLFMVGFDGTTVTPQIRTLIEQHHVGCVMLAAKNFQSAEQATRLILELQVIARQSGHVAPLLIAIDQENGGVSSLYDDEYIQQYPSSMGIAATGSKDLAREVARATAQELSAVGVNLILGPVLDVLNNLQKQPLGVRSFGNDAQQVSAFGVEYLQGYHDAGLNACGKHFPSYGNLEFLQSHGDVPVIAQSVGQLSMSALLPFKATIAQGIDAMLVGGCVIYEDGSPGTHACLSESVVSGLLRRDLKFDGVVISDCLEMESLIHAIGVSSGAVMTLKAGCDLILLCRSYPLQQEAIQGLQVAIENSTITMERIRESFGRLLELKSRCTSWEKALNPPGLNLLSIVRPTHLALSKRAYNESVTVVKDRAAALPLSRVTGKDEPLLLLTPHIKPLPASASRKCARDCEGLTVLSKDQLSWQRSTTEVNGEAVFREFGRGLTRARNGRVLHASYTSTGLSSLHESLIERCGAVIIVTANANQHRYQASFTRFVSLMCRSQQDTTTASKPVIVISVSSPFDFAENDKGVDCHICSYDFTEAAMEAVIRLLYGKISPSGTLPGSASTTQRPTQSTPHWLVENWNQDRDADALDSLLKTVQESSPPPQRSAVMGVSHRTFMLQSQQVDENHFVVRNSTTRSLYGFCATYVFRATGTGVLGAIIVHPNRRRMGIANSLHNRAIRTLLSRSDVRQFQLGSRIPSIFLGIPLSDRNEARRLRSWFSDMGWMVSKAHMVCTMVLRNLKDWVPPTLQGASALEKVDYEFMYDATQAGAILEMARTISRPGLVEQYDIALSAGSVQSGVIRAKRRDDGVLLGAIVVYTSQSRLAQCVPAVSAAQHETGGASGLMLSPMAEDPEALARSLVMHSTKMIKQLGGSAMVLDHIDDTMFDCFSAMGFTVVQSFDEVISDGSQWTIPHP
ncbi:hypothetical protein KEM52_004302 [Ascosphaera acerosa]|nr:hypothetical protein KEM52_004302 [Ascosphaera acerosa]